MSERPPERVVIRGVIPELETTPIDTAVGKGACDRCEQDGVVALAAHLADESTGWLQRSLDPGDRVIRGAHQLMTH